MGLSFLKRFNANLVKLVGDYGCILVYFVNLIIILIFSIISIILLK